MVMKKGDPIEEPIDPKPKPKPRAPVEEYPAVPKVAAIKRSMHKTRVEGGMVREVVIRSARITTGRNARLRSAELVRRLGLGASRAVVTAAGLIEMSDDLTDTTTKAKYVLAPLDNGSFKLVSVTMLKDTVPGKALAQHTTYTSKKLEQAIKSIDAVVEASEVSI